MEGATIAAIVLSSILVLCLLYLWYIIPRYCFKSLRKYKIFGTSDLYKRDLQNAGVTPVKRNVTSSYNNPLFERPPQPVRVKNKRADPNYLFGDD